MKSCPYCTQQIQDAAIKCRHCGQTVPSSASGPAAQPESIDSVIFAHPDGITITTRAARVGALTTSLTDLRGVYLAVTPANRIAGILVTLVGVGLLTFGMETGLGGDALYLGVIASVIGLALAITPKPWYSAMVEGDSGTLVLYRTRDRALAEAIVRSLATATGLPARGVMG